jgi:hypothetical protein
MKRSEMIKAIETEYRDFLDQIDLNALLDFLVSKGMQPPPREIEAYLVWVENEQAVKTPYTTIVNEWESEEDE